MARLTLRKRSVERAASWKPLPIQVRPPGDWRIWVLMGGRGSGKTAGGAHEAMEHLRKQGERAWVTIVAPTLYDCRYTCLEGESGLWTNYHHEFTVYNRSTLQLRHIAGGRVRCLGAEEPNRLRGPQSTFLWGDELAFWQEESFDNAMLGLRLGQCPQAVFTTTPKPRELMRRVLKLPRVVTTRGGTADNLHLAADVRQYFEEMYGGTRLGDQELRGLLLEDLEGALWRWEWIIRNRVSEAPELEFVSVAVDPAGGTKPSNAETGLAAVGRGVNGHYYLLASEGYRASPLVWGDRALAMYDRLKANELFGERNFGGDMVKSNIQTAAGDRVDEYLIVVDSATRGKDIRAEPIATLYEQGKFHHVGTFPEVENQQCRFPVDIELKDRLDALVWAGHRCAKGSGERVPLFMPLSKRRS